MSKRLALLIGNSEYSDPNLAKLFAPSHDVEKLAEALQDRAIGCYDVDLLLNAPFTEIRQKISRLYSRAGPKDQLVLYFSGHGVKDDMGRLYLATKQSQLDDLRAFSIEASFITASMDESRSRRQVLILDCCHAGAVVRGAKKGGDQNVGTSEQFCGNGQGRIILAACDAFQYAWDGQEMSESAAAQDGAASSMFTKHMIQGLVTGEADKDGDGSITVDELADYVSGKIVKETPKQRPRKFVFEADGHMVFARNSKVRLRKIRKRCFVVSPLSGDDGRHDQVFRTYIEPACEKAGYTAVRSDMQLSQKILPELMGSLRSDPMVVAYLGRPPWNANVMVEVGFRLASGKPLVLIRESTDTDGRGEQPLPFDLHDHRVIFLPRTSEVDQDGEIIVQRVDQIAELIKERGQSKSIWETPLARAKVKIDLENNIGKFFSASPMADRLFNCRDGLNGRELGDVINGLEGIMPRSQFLKFTDEQNRLIGQILGSGIMRSRRQRTIPYATRPIVFDRHELEPGYVQRAYLPVITRYSKQGMELWLDVIYLDVTKASERDPADTSAYICDLMGSGAVFQLVVPPQGPEIEQRDGDDKPERTGTGSGTF